MTDHVERAVRPTSHPGGHGHGGHGHGAIGQDFSDAAELLDLDAEVFAGLLRRFVGRVADALAGQPVGRVADLGCGSGTGALALAERFEQAQVFAVDAAAPLLDHLAARARERGLAERITPLVADLDDGWPPMLDRLDLVWASASLHHLADPGSTLDDVHGALVPGGVVALVEIGDLRTFQPSFLPGDASGAGPLGGLEERLRAPAIPAMRQGLPNLEADWRNLLELAGFTVEGEQLVREVLTPPLPVAAGRAAAVSLRRTREQLAELGLEDAVAPGDLAALDQLVADGPSGVEYRDDLAPRTERTLWIARKD